MSHFDEMTCLLYLEGQLERARARELSEHVEACGECRALLRALERESRLLVHALAEEDEAVPARLLAPPARRATPWAWIVSFGLAAAGAYTLWTGTVEPWREQLNQVGFGEGNLLTMLFFSGVFWKGWESMANILQFLALSTLGVVAYGLLRRGWRRRTTIAMVMAATAFALALPSTAGAAETRKAQSYTLPAGEVVKNDLIVRGQTVRIDGTVEGDLIAFGQGLTVNGRVMGDVIAFAQSLRINGSVDGNVRVFSELLTVTGAIGKNALSFAKTFEIDQKGQVGGSVTLFAAHVTLDGRVGRDLLGFIGHTALNGFIGGAVRIRGERLTIGPTAEIVGKASYRGRRQPDVSDQAKLASPLDIQIVKRRPGYASVRYYIKQALAWGAAFVFGLAIVLLLPGFFTDVVRSSRRLGPSLGFGIVMLIVTPVLAIIACVTIVGLSLGIGTLLLWLIALYSAQVFVGTSLGEKLMGAPVGTGAVLGRLAVGLLLLKIVGLVPYLGGLVKLLVVVWGLGALALAIYSRMRPLPAAPVTA